jgi:hypothetical protein
LKKYFSDEEKEKNKIKLKDLLTKIPAGLLGTLMKGGAIAAIAGGIIWGVIDGIAASMKAGEWGVSKSSAFIGGFLGGTESGFKGAFKSMGKWALIGAGTGFLAAGPIGAIIGGIIGAAIGFVLGYIGGKEIAKGVDGLKTKLGAAWKSKEFEDKILGIPKILLEGLLQGLTTFYSTIPVIIANIFTKDPKVLAKVKYWSKGIFEIIAEFSPFGFIKNWFSVTLDSIKRFKDKKEKKSLISKIIRLGADLITAPFQSIWKGISNSKLMKDFKITDFIEKVFKGIGNFFANVPANMEGLWEKAKELVGSIFTTAIDWFKGIGKKTLDLKDDIKEFISKTFSLAGEKVKSFFEKNTITNLIQDYLIDPVIKFFSMIGDTFDFIQSLGLQGILDIVTSKKKTFGGAFTEFQRDKTLKSPEYKDFEKAEVSKNKDFSSYSKDEKYDRYQNFVATKKVSNVHDAIIKPNGQIIRTDPSDTIIATKNAIEDKTILGDITDRNKIASLKEIVNNTTTNTVPLFSNASVESKLEAILQVLKMILAKDITLQLPPNTRGDLESIINGAIL